MLSGVLCLFSGAEKKMDSFDYVAAFNGVEVVWWTGLAVFLWAQRRRTPRALRSLSAWAILLLLLMAISEVIELRTGAWWRPWWLAVWKFTCGGLLGVFVLRAWMWWRANRTSAT